MITAGTAALKEVRRTLAAAWRRDVFHYAASLAVVQGGVFLAQLLVARILGPEAFGHVRVVDAGLQVLAVPAGMGMASAIVRYTATATDDATRRSLLAGALGWTALVSIVVAVVASLAAQSLPLSETPRRYLGWLVWTLVLTNVGRTIINYYQGRKEIRRVAGYSVALAGGAVVLTVGGAATLGLPGWAGGRALGEVLLAAVLAWCVRDALRARPDLALLRPMLVFGGYAAVSLSLDRIATMADTLYLDAFIRDSIVVGHYGAAVLAVHAAFLLPSAVTAVALPHIAERSPDVRAAWRYARGILARLMVGAAGLAALLVLAGPWALRTVLGAGYAPAGPLVQWLAIGFVFNVLMSYLGTFVLAIGKANLAMAQSVAGVVCNVGVNAVLIPRYGVWGAVAAAIATSAVRAAVLAGFTFRLVRRA